MYVCVCVCEVTSVVSDSFVISWTVTFQAPLSIGFSRQEYWSGLPCSPLGDLPDLRIKPVSPAAPELQGDSLPLSPGEVHSAVLESSNKQNLNFPYTDNYLQSVYVFLGITSIL